MRINLNWAAILSFVTFWSYGYYGSLTSLKIGLFWSTVVSVILYAIFILFLLLWEREPAYRDSIIITRNDILILLSYLAVVFLFSFRELKNPLRGDQLCHATYSQLQGMHSIFKLERSAGLFNNFIFSHLLQTFDLLLLAAAAIFYYTVRNKPFIAKVILYSAAFILLRSAIFAFGGYEDGHPPFRLFPLWLSGTVFSIRSISFRLPQFFVLILLMWASQKMARERSSPLQAWLFGLAVGTIPVLWHIGTLAIESIWSAAVWIILLLMIWRCENPESFKWLRWSSIIAIASLMRQSAFIGFVPLFFLFFIYNLRERRFNLKDISLIAFPLLAMLPFILKSMIVGMPSTYVPGAVSFIPEDASMIDRVMIAMRSGIALKYIIGSLMFPWIIFFPFAFIPLKLKSRTLMKSITALLFFATAFFTFYSIAVTEWGTSKYQAEYAVPFAVLGLFQVLSLLNKFGKRATKFLVTTALIVLSIFNFFVFRNMYSHNNTGVIFDTPYAYDEALKAVKEKGYAGSELIAGLTYGVFLEITNGYTVKEVASSRAIYKEATKSLGMIDRNILSSDMRIRLILVADMWKGQKEPFMHYLLSSGWKTWREFRHPISGTVIYGFVR